MATSLTILPTTMGTSNPPNICSGFALFPSLGTARAGISSNQTSRRLVNLTDINLVVFEFSAEVSLTVNLGMCGPAYGIRLSMEGGGTRDILDLKVSNDRTDAGFFVGASFSLAIEFEVAHITGLRWVDQGWNSRLEVQMSAAFEVSFNVTFDIIELIFSFLADALENSGRRGAGIAAIGLNTLPGPFASFSMMDSDSNVITEGNGNWTLEPDTVFPVDVVSILAATDPGWERIVNALAEAGATIGFGPQITIVVPVNFRLARVFVDDATFQLPAWDAQGTLNVVRLRGVAPGPNPRDLSVEIEHRVPEIRFRIGAFFNLTLVKVINFSPAWNIDLPRFLSIPLNTSPVFNYVTNRLGNTTVSPLFSYTDAEDGMADYEVVFV